MSAAAGSPQSVPVVVRRTVEVMGTVVSLAVRLADDGAPGTPGADDVDAAWARATAVLREADEVFSTYRPDSVVNRWGRGELAVDDAPPELAEVLMVAETARLASGGAFDITAVRSPHGGGPDPSGVVKGWAVQRAAAALEDLPGVDYCLAAGGDMVCRVRTDGGAPWRVGIEDPAETSRLLAVVPVLDGAVATSGTAHRGEHIADPRTGAPPRALRQVTVIAPTLLEADVDATAAFVLGEQARSWLEARGRSGVLVDAAGRALTFAPSPVPG